MVFGVRSSTFNDTVLIESGYLDLETLLKLKQKRLFEKLESITMSLMNF